MREVNVAEALLWAFVGIRGSHFQHEINSSNRNCGFPLDFLFWWIYYYYGDLQSE
jgi:hypothetical protein